MSDYSQETAIKLLINTKKIICLKKRQVKLYEDMVSTVQLRVMFGLPLKGGLEVRKLINNGHASDNKAGCKRHRGEVHLVLDKETVRKIDIQKYYALLEQLEDAETEDDVIKVYTDQVVELLSGE